jgi:hypothetical protein
MIELLLKKGGNPDVCGAKGYKLLLLALLAGHGDCHLSFQQNG